MKKIIYSIISIILVLSMIGCNKEITIQEQAKEEYIQLQYYYNRYLDLAIEYNKCKEMQLQGYTFEDERIKEIENEMEILYNEFCNYAFNEDGEWNLSNDYSEAIATDLQTLLYQCHTTPENNYMAVPNFEDKGYYKDYYKPNQFPNQSIDDIQIDFEILLEAIQTNDFTNYRGKHYQKAQRNREFERHYKN